MYLQVKSLTFTQTFDRFYPNRPDQRQQMTTELNGFESQIQFPSIPGGYFFLEELKSHGVKTGFVTSWNDTKMSNNYIGHPTFKSVFDVLVIPNDFPRSKADPQCYRTAAEELGLRNEDCFVFDDSFAGIKQGARHI
jgi:HAD superfamily hydrolase (TIGR01509 family)